MTRAKFAADADELTSMPAAAAVLSGPVAVADAVPVQLVQLALEVAVALWVMLLVFVVFAEMVAVFVCPAAIWPS